MRKAFTVLLLAAAVSTSGCAALRGTASTPDEFAVARNAPLIIPPDYNLAPPVAGTAGTATDVQQQAIDALFGGPAPRSQSETSVLEAAGRDRVATGIRSNVGDPATNVVDKGATTQAIIAAPEGDGQDASAQTPQ